ncbi:MAG: hypothetical protein AAF549_06170 [Pseudomonadota bacterium]
MSQKSLHQIMNDIVGRLDSLQPHEHSHAPNKKKKKSRDPLSEIEAFMKLDDLLARLHRQYLEAKAQRKDLTKAHGSNDPMTEIAMDMEDSAYCAFQTRYIEVRQIQEMMARAQRLMREREEEIELEKRKEREKEFQNFILLSKLQEKARQRGRMGGFEYAVLLLIFNLVPVPNYNYGQQFQNNARLAA